MPRMAMRERFLVRWIVDRGYPHPTEVTYHGPFGSRKDAMEYAEGEDQHWPEHTAWSVQSLWDSEE